jgi:type III secretion system FlhB-like substrate exporter
MTDAERLIAAKQDIDILLQIDNLKDNENILFIRSIIIRFIEMPGSKVPDSLYSAMAIIFMYAKTQLEEKNNY